MDLEGYRQKAISARKAREVKEEIKSTLSSDIEAFLAKGGSIEKVRDCSVREARFRAIKPYVTKKVNGKKAIKRKETSSRFQIYPDAFGGHQTK